eukprot:TRINITY_DN38419_c0_g1_i1.p1 TRINITY_DN38419_c0_g1~~TRINITY_DN38419_c0_g1_i1.p1  ORF type:complete len:273 (+),score=41.19 TRINITY_DN38419_c0_g1_i1:26-844(+)
MVRHALLVQSSLVEGCPAPQITGKLRLGAAAMLLLGCSFAGFVPAALFFVQEGVWKLDPFYMAMQSLPSSVLNLHSCTAFCWSFGAVLQVAMGVGWLPKKLHRPLGYVLFAVGCLAFASGTALVLISASPLPEGLGAIAIDHITAGCLAICNLVFAVSYARDRKFLNHAQAALMCIAWASYPGASRLVGFLLSYVTGYCALIFFSGWEAVTVAVILAVSAAASWRADGKQWLLFANLVALALVTANDLTRAIRRGEFLECSHHAEQIWHMWQ